MMAKRLAPGCCIESPIIPVSNQVTFDAGGKSAHNAIHLSHHLMSFVEFPGSWRTVDGERWKDADSRIRMALGLNV
jgi:hypothetical protein